MGKQPVKVTCQNGGKFDTDSKNYQTLLNFISALVTLSSNQRKK